MSPSLPCSIFFRLLCSLVRFACSMPVPTAHMLFAFIKSTESDPNLTQGIITFRLASNFRCQSQVFQDDSFANSNISCDDVP
jgi:hypothetical protein